MVEHMQGYVFICWALQAFASTFLEHKANATLCVSVGRKKKKKLLKWEI